MPSTRTLALRSSPRISIPSPTTIRENPHDRSATGLVGLIRQVLPGAGIANCDLFRVAYTDPATGLRHIYPFSAGMLEPASPRT